MVKNLSGEGATNKVPEVATYWWWAEYVVKMTPQSFRAISRTFYALVCPWKISDNTPQGTHFYWSLCIKDNMVFYYGTQMLWLAGD